MPAAHRAMLHANLRRLFNPRSIAFVGGRAAEPAIRMAQRAGFGGPIHAVNPKLGSLAGITCHTTVDDLPDPPDATFLYVGRELITATVAALARNGAGGAVCYAAGYGEAGQPEGDAHEAALTAVVGDLALLGPNANGMINTLDGVTLWPVESHAPRRHDRGVAIISQSGTVAFNYVDNRRGVHAAYIVSVGNQRYVDVADVVEVLASDPRVAAIGMYLEGIPDIPRFAAAATTAAQRGIAMAVMKVGRTETGARMALTHTGALAGGDAFYRALFDRLGIIRVPTLNALDETLKLLAVVGLPAGRRVAAVTMCGAWRTIFADAADDAGLVFPEPDSAVTAVLRAQIPRFAVVSNPLDYNAPYTGQTGLSLENYPALKDCFETLLRVPHDLAVMIDNFDASGDDAFAARPFEAWVKAVDPHATPRVLIAGVPDALSAPFREACIRHGIAPLMGIEDGVAAIAAALTLAERRALPPPPPLDALPPVLAEGLLLDEDDSKARLAAFGLVVPDRIRTSVHDAPAAAVMLGFPVALKAISANVAHKSKVGGVMLGLRDSADVAAAVMAIVSGFAAQGLPLDGLLVERMVPQPELELIAGIVRDDRFGLALLLGPGGVRVERMDPPPLLLLPVGDAALRAHCMAVAARHGVEPALPALLTAVRAIIGFAAQHRDTLLELDVNPLIVSGTEVIAVDAVIRLAGG